MRIFTVSDLHADYAENLSWVLQLNEQVDDDFSEDMLIVAGDICDGMELLREVLDCLSRTFKQVFFVPGNHELWVGKDGFSCSLDKFYAVESLCAQLGVQTQPMTIADLSIVPLYSWYDFSFGEPDNYLRRAWRDFRACKWPNQLSTVESVSAHFLAMNESRLNIRNKCVISFSHFLPRIDVMPAAIPEKRRRIYPVLGSDRLGEQVECLNPDIHIYGHSHVNQCKSLRGISYINNAFAYPSEQKIARKVLHCVYETIDESREFHSSTKLNR